ncbi:MAG: HAMP domain-containing protein [Desulfobacterales bacterium]|nr:HAMP domain-containing protein [Desulfobacterales bacterium]
MSKLSQEVSQANINETDITDTKDDLSEYECADFDENKALWERPSFSVRTRLMLAFTLIFSFCLVITLWAIYMVAEIQTKIYFLEISGNYMLEIQQARRFEKNFFLYGTNLADAKEHLLNAEQILKENGLVMESFLGNTSFTTMSNHLVNYHALLLELDRNPDTKQLNQIESDLRQHGSQMVSFAMDLVNKERESLGKIIFWARWIPVLFLFILFASMVLVATFLARQLWGTLNRFMEYTERIGYGDFTPITPKRKYRDEFTQLAMAFNRMTHELDRRQKILVESHKLRAIGTLVAGVAHELNNPLNNTMLTASLLQEDFETLDKKDQLEMIQDIINETERSRKIVRNLLNFARKSETKITSLNMEQILENAITLISNQLKMSKINLVREFSKDIPSVHGDQQTLEQVFINLILNAVDSLPQKGTITIGIHKTEYGFVAVDVKDNGIGIPEHILSRVFEPFFTTKGKGKGTGLGLSVSQGIIKKHGGDIQVTSRIGEGTMFTVLLPITEVPSHISAG